MKKFTYWAATALLAVATPAQADIKIKMLKPIVEARVDLSTQRLNLYVNGEQTETWKISSGRGRYATPNGSFSPYRMHKMWYSRKYNNAPMPYAVFYDGGYAVHGTNAVSRLGRPASHGCVRLDTRNAKKFYELVRTYGRNRTQVSVSGAWRQKRTKQAQNKKAVNRVSVRRTKKRWRTTRGLARTYN